MRAHGLPLPVHLHFTHIPRIAGGARPSLSLRELLARSCTPTGLPFPTSAPPTHRRFVPFYAFLIAFQGEELSLSLRELLQSTRGRLAVGAELLALVGMAPFLLLEAGTIPACALALSLRGVVRSGGGDAEKMVFFMISIP